LTFGYKAITLGQKQANCGPSAAYSLSRSRSTPLFNEPVVDLSKLNSECENHDSPLEISILRKEVIQPQVPLRLPCYDFTPIINHTLGTCLLLEASWPSNFWYSQLSWCDGRCVQGPGTHSPWHADPRLLAIPTSWSRIADSNPN
jgi:hypothetical protein